MSVKLSWLIIGLTLAILIGSYFAFGWTFPV